MTYTVEQYRAAAKKAAAAGDLVAAEELVAAGRALEQSQKSGAQSFKEFFLGDDDPTTQNLGEKIGSALNKAGESLTFGLIGDETSAAVESVLPGVNYEDRRDHYRQQEEVLERDSPGTALTADIGGAVAGSLLPLGAIGTLGRGAGLLKRSAASAGAGAGMAGAYGFAEGEGDRLGEARSAATIGGALGAAVPVVGGAAQKVVDALVGHRAMRGAAQNAPTAEQLRALGNRAYQEVDEAGVQIRPETFSAARREILEALRSNTGFDELPGPGSLTPKTARVTEIMGKASDEMTDPTAALPFRALDQMRRQAGAAAGDVTNKADQKAGMTVIEGLDDLVKRLGPDDVAAGDVDALKTAIPKAREIWSRMSRSQLIDDAIEQEGNYLSGGASAIRNRVASILRNPKLSRGFSEAEKKAMQRVVSGSIPQQIVNYLGSGLGMMGQMGAGFAVGGVPGALAGTALATGSRALSNSMTRRNAEMARAIIANGGLNTLPVATDSTRRIVEALSRRTAAASLQ